MSGVTDLINIVNPLFHSFELFLTNIRKFEKHVNCMNLFYFSFEREMGRAPKDFDSRSGRKDNYLRHFAQSAGPLQTVVADCPI